MQPATKGQPSSCQATEAGVQVCSRGAAPTVNIALALLPLAPKRGPACPAGLARSLVIPPTALLQRGKALKDVCRSVLTPPTFHHNLVSACLPDSGAVTDISKLWQSSGIG